MVLFDNRKPCIIRFKHRALSELRSALLGKEQRESFAVLLAKRQVAGETEIFTVSDLRFPAQQDYEERRRAYLRVRKKFIHSSLAEAMQRLDIDTLIDVHTHPFAQENVSFSRTDDNDEQGFATWLTNHFDDLHFLSIVLSQTRYQARVWRRNGIKFQEHKAIIKPQTVQEYIPASHEGFALEAEEEERLLLNMDGIFNRGALALGLGTMRAIMMNQTVALVGVGGIGSVMAEHLVQMGFRSLILIDPDRLDTSNLNRFVGASFSQAQAKCFKVEAVESHLKGINPEVSIITSTGSVENEIVHELLANSDWILLSTDNHSSRWETQRLALRYFIPLISVGVNISVKDGRIDDMSGEIITARSGDRWCLNCLGRISLAKLAAESHPEETVRRETVQKGYVTGMAVKEPAVKTLNTIVASIAVDRLVDQFLPNRPDIPVLVYEHNKFSSIYEDHASLEQRQNCCHCYI